MSDRPSAFGLAGVSFRKAKLADREQLAVATDAQIELQERLAADGVAESVVISTCNRVEVYVSVPAGEGEGDDAPGRLERAIGKLTGEWTSRVASIAPAIYTKIDSEALLHLFRVASSLDSLVVGEPQILGQVKEAFDHAKQAGFAGRHIERVMSKAFFVAKRVRTETQLGSGQVSVASVAVDLASRIFESIKECAVLLVGAGQIAEAAARALVAAGAKKLSITNRSIERAQDLASNFDGARVVAYESLLDAVVDADVVLVSTGAPSFVLTKDDVGKSMKRRKGRALFIVDLAVPRNVDPNVHALENCYRYDIDDLEQIVGEGREERAQEVATAERIVAEEGKAFVGWQREQTVADTLVEFRQTARSLVINELEKSFRSKLQHLPEGDRKLVSQAAEAALNKLLHHPTSVIREAAHQNDRDSLVAAIRRLFDLK